MKSDDCVPAIPAWNRAPPAIDDERPVCQPTAEDASALVVADTAARRLNRVYAGGPPFFESTPPYVTMLVHDSHDPNCDLNYTTPKTDKTEAGYPADGTGPFRKVQMSCGVAIARFVFFTSGKTAYTDPSYTAVMQLKVDCNISTFLESDTCENVLDATSNDTYGFPRISRCRFMKHEMRLITSTRLKPYTKYEVTVKLLNPAGRHSASENSFHLTTEYYQVGVIEGTRAPQDMTYIIPNAKDWSHLEEADYQKRWDLQSGYITSFMWKPKTGEWFPDTGRLENRFNFEIRTWGKMTGTGTSSGMYYKIMFVAYPTNVWKFCLNGQCREPFEACDWSPGPKLSTGICDYFAFQGASSVEANGFIITIKGTPLENLNEEFTIKADNPPRGVNLYWTATSYRYDSGGAMFEPYTVLCNAPVPVIGVASGRVAKYQIAAVNVEQWIELEFKPGNTMLGSTLEYAGTLVIIPPDNFQVVASARPRDAGEEYNALPCNLWPSPDREARITPRWVCTVGDQALFTSTLYRVQLRVVNPSRLGGARSWRVEMWQWDQAGGWVGGPRRGVKPISVTRSLLGFPISGTMQASIAPNNQLLAGANGMRIEFVPTNDIGSEPLTRLKVVAPPGFIIVKRCRGFDREPPMVLPECACEGSDSNSFDLVFTYGDAIKANNRYIFYIEMVNPSANSPPDLNIWRFDTVRPDGIPRDTAVYDGFYLFPVEMASFIVVPTTRAVGPNPVVVRFVSQDLIPFDDFLTIRAPLGVMWYEDDLAFSADNSKTSATTVGVASPTVDPMLKNILTVQLATAVEADIEYGFFAKCMIPLNTPVPNRWWIEQKRQTGLAAPNEWRYIASTGAEGFKSLVLINTVVEPFNVREEAWENPTLITFEATQTVQSMQKVLSSGLMNVSAEVRITAPQGFTWICPLSPTIYLPEFAVPVPDNLECEVDHNNLQRRNELSLFFPDGVQAEVRYALTIDLTNGRMDEMDLSKNFFHLATYIDGNMIEDATVPGFLLAKRMDNTRFIDMPIRDGQRKQNFFPEYPNNDILFYVGATEEITQDTILEIKAPRGFEFPSICTDTVSYPGGAFGLEGIIQLPTIKMCKNLADEDIDLKYVAHIYMSGTWLLGTTGITVTVKNPMRTPLRNFWSITILNTNREPLQTEARVYGFEIAVVLDPMFRPTLMGRGVDKEAAINTCELSFSVTTTMPGRGDRRNQIVVTAPEGFVFPNVCRFFSVDTGYPGEEELPEETHCMGDGATQLLLTLPIMRPLFNMTRYGFRFRVINPSVTIVATDTPRWWWSITTRTLADELVDQTRDIPSFPIYNRVSFIQVDTLSPTGLNATTYRMLFRTSAPLAPKQKITISPPPGFIFGGLDNQLCIDVDPMIVKKLFDEDAGKKPVIAGVTRLPEWMVCRVYDNTVVLTNEEPLLGGRPLINGPVFEFFVMNATNAEATPPPGMNLFKVEAKTMIEYGIEEFVGEGWTIYPELLMTKVETSNTGFGLFTNFTFTLRTVSMLPAGGSIRIVGPNDYYFGPLIETPETEYDPLTSAPPPQGALEEDRPTSTIKCAVLRAKGWACPFELTPCKQAARYEDLISIGVELSGLQSEAFAYAKTICSRMQEQCDTTALSRLVSCQSVRNELIVTLLDGVVLPARRAIRFLIQGYNTRRSKASMAMTTFGPVICTDCPGNEWMFQTRDKNSEKTVLDSKSGIPGVELLGIVSVLSIIPADSKVSSIENYVTVRLRLAVPCDPKGMLRITHPIEYMKNANAAFQGSPVSTGPNFPRMKEIKQSLNVIEILAIEERIPANVDIEVSIIMSNPTISPSRAANVWTFEASSDRTGERIVMDVNYNVSGFKIFGEYSWGQITPTVRAPKSDSIIGVYFVLKSELPQILNPRNYPKGMRIWMPKGFVPNPPPRAPLWVPVTCNADFSLNYNKYREGIIGFPQDINYFGLPSGSSCKNEWSKEYEQYYAKIKIDAPAEVRYGDPYAFEIGVTNPTVLDMPPASENFWRIETVMDNVILHLRTGLPGYDLEQIKEVKMKWFDSTTLRRLHPLEFYIMSDKYIPGGSVVKIESPEGFKVGCVFFRPILGLSSTTTCLAKAQTRVDFTIDSQDPKKPNTPFAIRVMWKNPEFTPQENWWKVSIFSPLQKAIDVRDFIPGFDITDRIQFPEGIVPTFPFLMQKNKLQVVFMQYTILNQADNGNELVLTAPEGWTFPVECSAFDLQLNDQALRQDVDANGYPTRFVFPPPGTLCTGFNNRTVVVRLPNGAGLLKNVYMLEVDVLNPGYRPNGTNVWQMLTRVRNVNGTKIVDRNSTIEGFELSELVPIRTDESGAGPRSSLLHIAGMPVVILLSAVLTLCTAGAGSDDGRTARPLGSV